jgi:hypothetical protein
MTNKGGKHLILVGTLTVDVKLAMRYAEKVINRREKIKGKCTRKILSRQHGK